MKKCLYCNVEIVDGRVIDICDKCGSTHIGEQMFEAMKENMENAHANGDLCHHKSDLG